MARFHYYVQPSGLQWKLTDGLGKEHYFPTQTAAANEARRSAQRDFSQGFNAQVHIARPNGRWRTEWTYGNDPAKYPS
jgi:hypothetical protein